MGPTSTGFHQNLSNNITDPALTHATLQCITSLAQSHSSHHMHASAMFTIPKCMCVSNRCQAQFALYWNHQSYPGYDVKASCPLPASQHNIPKMPTIVDRNPSHSMQQHHLHSCWACNTALHPMPAHIPLPHHPLHPWRPTAWLHVSVLHSAGSVWVMFESPFISWLKRLKHHAHCLNHTSETHPARIPPIHQQQSIKRNAGLHARQ